MGIAQAKGGLMGDSRNSGAQWNLAVNSAFCNIFPLYVALLSVPAYYFLYWQMQQFIIYKNVICNLP